MMVNRLLYLSQIKQQIILLSQFCDNTYCGIFICHRFCCHKKLAVCFHANYAGQKIGTSSGCRLLGLRLPWQLLPTANCSESSSSATKGVESWNNI
jgi:hypothetical protein